VGEKRLIREDSAKRKNKRKDCHRVVGKEFIKATGYKGHRPRWKLWLERNKEQEPGKKRSPRGGGEKFEEEGNEP